MKKAELVSKLMDNVKDQDKKIKDFDDILSKIDTLDSNKKILWLEIYRNAVVDRTAAYALFNDLFKDVITGGMDMHTMMGVLLSKYLERISKSNDQILKLSELVSKETVPTKQINSEDLFDQIEK